MSGTSALIGAVWIDDIGKSLRESFFMFWETFWALALGFVLSGAVQAFVSREQMQRLLGNHRPVAVVRASGYGMVSSSCSYAATAMAKSLFAKGADFVSALVFQFASTNLVIELGIVMIVLLGWQFAAAEFVGGPIMIALLVLAGSVVLRGTLVARARERLASPAGDAHDTHGKPHASRSGTPRTMAGWSDAAGYAVADATMLRREMAIGYIVAGLLAVVVPTPLWNDAFVRGHGFFTSLENALVGPLIAIVSWVCSIGNVPLAAALWKGGISFGGVIAFIFADLIAMPLILIYRKLYGGALALRMVLVFYTVMAGAGLVVEGIFSAAGIVPHHRPVQIAPEHFSWNYTSILNIVFLGVSGGIWWLHRERERFGGGSDYARDPVCGMQVRIAEAPASSHHRDRTVWFCSDRCRERFEEEPERYTP